MLFVLYCVDKPDHGHVRAANRPAHLEFIRSQTDKVLIGGPMLTEDGSGMIGSMAVLDVPDRAAAEAFARDDPYARAGLFESVVIRRYRKVFPEG